MTGSDTLPEAPSAVRARLYAALHVGTPGDIEFYLRVCAGARKVLEYGCGAGRVALALAERGQPVVGVDLDAELLTLARERQAEREAALGRRLPIQFLEGDMTVVSKRGCDRVIIPYSALWCLIGTEAKRKCLANARASLRRGGQLALDVYDADVMADDDFSEYDASSNDAPAVEQDDYEELHRVRLDDVTYGVWERNCWNRATRSMQVDYRVIAKTARRRAARLVGASSEAAAEAAPRRGLAPRRSRAPVAVSPSDALTAAVGSPNGYQLTIRHSVLWRHELAQLLEECGFEAAWGVDEAGEATPFAEQVVVRATRT